MIDDSKMKFEMHARQWKLNLEPNEPSLRDSKDPFARAISDYKDPITHAAWTGYETAIRDYQPLWRLQHNAAMKIIRADDKLFRAYLEETDAKPWMDQPKDELEKVLKYVQEALELRGYPKDDYLMAVSDVKVRLLGERIREEHQSKEEK